MEVEVSVITNGAVTEVKPRLSVVVITTRVENVDLKGTISVTYSMT